MSTVSGSNAAKGGVQAALHAIEQPSGKYMTFKLGEEQYGFPISYVRDVVGMTDITKVPRTKSYVRGVFKLRGTVIPLMDLRVRLGMGQTKLVEQQTVIIVLHCEMGRRDITVGFLVDEVLEVVDIDANQIAPAPDLGTGTMDSSFIKGFAMIEDLVVFLLNAETLLSGPASGQAGEGASRPQELAATLADGAQQGEPS